MSKIGRNDPCTCGSDKKYKKCCLQLHEKGIRKVPPEEAAIIKPLMDAEYRRKHPEPYMHIVPNVEFAGRRIRAVWSTVHYRPLNETFHEFIIGFLVHTLGEEWAKEERAKPDEKRHVAIRWVEAVKKWMAENHSDENRVGEHEWALDVSGYAQSLLQFAYDMYVLQVVNKLSEELIHRLRDRRQFQGARYEVGVASMFARAGFEIEFCQPEHGKMICEFIAHHKSGLNIAVEAKSRHRPGVLHEKGEPSQEVKGDIKKLYERAREKKPEMPFVIFIDANLPPMPGVPWEKLPWLEDVKEVMSAFPTPTVEKPDPHNCVCITNYGFYYNGDAKSEHQACLCLYALIPKYPFTHPEAWDALWKTVERYTTIPRDV